MAGTAVRPATSGKAGMPRLTAAAAAGDEPVDLGELGVRCGEADLQALGFAEPAFALGFGDAGDQVVADLGEPRPLAWADPEERASDTAVLMDAGGPVGPAAFAERDPPAFEVAEEFFPFLVGRESGIPRWGGVRGGGR